MPTLEMNLVGEIHSLVFRLVNILLLIYVRLEFVMQVVDKKNFSNPLACFPK